MPDIGDLEEKQPTYNGFLRDMAEQDFVIAWNERDNKVQVLKNRHGVPRGIVGSAATIALAIRMLRTTIPSTKIKVFDDMIADEITSAIIEILGDANVLEYT